MYSTQTINQHDNKTFITHKWYSNPMEKEKKPATKQKKEPMYNFDDVMKITEDIFNLCNEKKYHPGAFIHGLILAVEYTQVSFKIPQEQIATIKRECRKFLQQAKQTPDSK